MRPFYIQLVAALFLMSGAGLFGIVVDSFNVTHALIIILLVIGGVLLSTSAHMIVNEEEKVKCEFEQHD